jgi:molybdate transport system substrate-binding protein
MNASLHLLSGGAAHGLVRQLSARFQADSGLAIDGRFGAVGMMRDALLAGAPCDVAILTAALIAQLTASGHLAAGSARPVGVVQTGVAVPHGEPAPAVDSPEALRSALLAATGIYMPDPVQSTAGIHVMKVLAQLGIAEAVAARLRPYPNGATAMREMSSARPANGLIGCTQVTEILDTPGVRLAAPLPAPLGLATVYTAAIGSAARHPRQAEALIRLLTHEGSAEARREAGFE